MFQDTKVLNSHTVKAKKIDLSQIKLHCNHVCGTASSVPVQNQSLNVTHLQILTTAITESLLIIKLMNVS